MNQERLSAIVPERLEDHWPDLLRFARSLAGNPDWADEIAQESMVRALQRDPQLPTVANPRGWLFQIAANVFREWWRRRARESSVLERFAEQTTRRSHPIPSDVAEQQERLLAIWSFIQTLPEMQRRVLITHVVEGSSHLQIAEQLGMTTDHVKANLFAARRKLRMRFLNQDESELNQDTESP